MKKLFFLPLLLIIIFYSNITKADNLGLYGINLQSNLYDVINNKIDEGYKIIIFGNNLDNDYAQRLLQLQSEYEEHIENNPDIKDKILYDIILDEKDIFFRLSEFEFNFYILNEHYKRILDFYIKNYINFTQENYSKDLKIIPILLSKDNININIIFYSYKDDNFKPLYFEVKFDVENRKESVDAAINILNERFGNNIKSPDGLIWYKDNTLVLYPNKVLPVFIFYNPSTMIEFNNIANEIMNNINYNEKNTKEKQYQDKVNQLQKGM